MDSGNVDSFLVRESVTHPGDYTLEVRCHDDSIMRVRVDYKVVCSTLVLPLIKSFFRDYLLIFCFKTVQQIICATSCVQFCDRFCSQTEAGEHRSY